MSEAQKSVTISDLNFWMMILSTLRYAMGRRSYITSLVPELVIQYQDVLEVQQLRQIQQEVVEELRKYNEVGRTMGDKCDDDGWFKFVLDLGRIITNRAAS
jgi:hypothetical protein